MRCLNKQKSRTYYQALFSIFPPGNIPLHRCYCTLLSIFYHHMLTGGSQNSFPWQRHISHIYRVDQRGGPETGPQPKSLSPLSNLSLTPVRIFSCIIYNPLMDTSTSNLPSSMVRWGGVIHAISAYRPFHGTIQPLHWLSPLMHPCDP